MAMKGKKQERQRKSRGAGVRVKWVKRHLGVTIAAFGPTGLWLWAFTTFSGSAWKLHLTADLDACDLDSTHINGPFFPLAIDKMLCCRMHSCLLSRLTRLLHPPMLVKHFKDRSVMLESNCLGYKHVPVSSPALPV